MADEMKDSGAGAPSDVAVHGGGSTNVREGQRIYVSPRDEPKNVLTKSIGLMTDEERAAHVKAQADALAGRNTEAEAAGTQSEE
jgi:hypothetical protein